MDRIDSEIVRLLLQNARISMSEISSCVNLSVSAVSERLKKLESSGMIQQYTAILNPQAFNKDLTVFMLITLESSNSATSSSTMSSTKRRSRRCITWPAALIAWSRSSRKTPPPWRRFSIRLKVCPGGIQDTDECGSVHHQKSIFLSSFTGFVSVKWGWRQTYL